MVGKNGDITTSDDTTEQERVVLRRRIDWSNPSKTDSARTGKETKIYSSYGGDFEAETTETSGTGATKRFGDIPGGNYTEIEEDGTIEFNGDATVWEDLNFTPLTGGGPPSTQPDDVTINNVFHKEFTNSNNQLCGDSQEIPHEAKLSTTHYPHAHIFLKSGESSGTTGVTFTFYWELRDSTGTTSGSVDLSATSAELAANGNKINISDATGFAGSDELGAQLAVTLARTGGDAGDVIVTTYGIHYEIDTVGSREITTK